MKLYEEGLDAIWPAQVRMFFEEEAQKTGTVAPD